MRRSNITEKEFVLSEKARMTATPFGCGQCLHCRINKQREWKHRILLEASLYNQNCFVTLTYDDDTIPDGKQLYPRDLTNYLKRLRRRINPGKFRYFGVGEYGTLSDRPHYHLALFGIGILDYPSIDKAWEKKGKRIGFTHIGDINHHTADYITGYCIKKMNSKHDPSLNGRHPEFIRTSRGKPGGIGAGAVIKIAKKLKKSKFYDNKKLPRSLVHGGNRSYPLGRYLTEIMARELEIDQNYLDQEMYDYQEEIILKNIGGDKIFAINLLDQMEPKKRRQKGRHKFYKKRRHL